MWKETIADIEVKNPIKKTKQNFRLLSLKETKC